ncbi:MAG TPA: tetratricopeptide repeat protein [Chthoniobacterales bacterium]|nr:tetratricopeptide repeat protein [Chthoniobacterales bacterium]
MDLKNLLAELKRRNVYKVAIAYAIVAWLLIQIATQVFPFFEIPAWVVRLVVLLLLIGFPLALILAWAFEITSEGIVRTEDVEPYKSIAHETGRKLTVVIAIIAVIATGLLLFQLSRRERAPLPAIASLEFTEKSIAVLPFENRSEEKTTAYFADGIQDEILTRLAKIGALKVISRTSTQHYKSAPENLPLIAKQLGVANILEGAVQKSGENVRVNVQLINAATDAHLWAEIYDRKLTDIFKVESEIAAAIAETLQAKLTGAEKKAIAKHPTANPEAYELYLKGRFFWNKRTGADLQTSLQYFEQAIAKDPNYALAYAGLAESYVLLGLYAVGPPEQSVPKARAAAKKALELDGTLAEAHTALGLTLALYDWDFAASAKEFESAIESNPNYATAHQWFGNSTLLITGDFDRAIAEGKRAVQLDPLSLVIIADLGGDYMMARRYDEAIAEFKKVLAMDSRFYNARWQMAEALQLNGQLQEAIKEYEKTINEQENPRMLALLSTAYAGVGKRDEALKLLAQLDEAATRRYVGAYNYALAHMGLGEKEKAIDDLERAYRERSDPHIVNLKFDPMLDPLRGDPRFEALVQKVFSQKR